MSERPMRILHVITKLDVGGAQSVVHELATRQRTAGHSVQVATGLTGPVGESLVDQGITVSVLPDLVHPLAPGKDRRVLQQLVELIRANPPDVMHTHSSKGGLLGRAAARRSGVPSVYTAHGWPFQPGAPAAQRIKSLMIEWAGAKLGDEVVCVTQSELNLARRCKVGRRSHLHVIANGIAELPAPERPLRKLGDHFNLVMVARLSPPKRADLAVQAVALSADHIRLTIVGDGELAPGLRQQIQSVGVTKRVVMGGVLDPFPVLETADAFCLFSNYEGLPMTVLEAMRAGLPVIASDLPGIAEALGPDAGFLCGSPDEATAAIRRLADDPDLTVRMGRAARQRWEQRFSAARMADAYETLYRSLLTT